MTCLGNKGYEELLLCGLPGSRFPRRVLIEATMVQLNYRLWETPQTCLRGDVSPVRRTTLTRPREQHGESAW